MPGARLRCWMHTKQQGRTRKAGQMQVGQRGYSPAAQPFPALRIRGTFLLTTPASISLSQKPPVCKCCESNISCKQLLPTMNKRRGLERGAEAQESRWVGLEPRPSSPALSVLPVLQDRRNSVLSASTHVLFSLLSLLFLTQPK